MWGLSTRGARLGDGRRPGRVFDVGLVRMTVRGPAEHAVLEIVGELDFTYAEDVVRAATALPHRVVGLDLGGLEFVDGEGALALSRIAADAEARWGQVPEITGSPRAVQRTRDLVASCQPLVRG